uniref:Zinc finger PHD-type domain-containing protein n=1 Tax=Corethron hystrix TaxID=216773 RepID=A0A7S1BXB0_9STRA|mmetsp:Transcript_42989/g.100901  ORF Transcript_42989/g.100901 Transcript_42989/m.100901 type:complete len:850 (+) Transcript_42989:1061-3610(+)
MNTLFGPTDKMSGEQRARGGEARKGTSISPELIKKRKTSIDLQKNNGSLTENEVLTNNSVAKLLKISEVRQDVSKKPVFSRKVNIELKQDTIRETQNVQNEYKTDDFDFVFYGEGVNDKSEMTLIQDSQNCHRKKKQGEENVKDACNVENVAKPKNIEVCSKDIKQLAREGRLAFDLHVVQDDNNVGKTNFALGGEDKNDMTQNVQDADEADNTGFLFGKKDIYGKNEMTLIQESQHFQKKQLEQGEKKLQNICNVENAQNAKDIETSVEYIRKHAIKENQSYDLHVVQEENYVGKKNLLHDGKDENHINQSVQDVHAVEYDGLEWKRKGRHGESEMNSIQDSQNFQKNKVKQGKKNMTDMCNAQNDQNIQDAKDIKTCAKDVRQHNRKESCSFDLHVVQGDYVRKENVLQNEKDKNYMIQNVQNVDEADDNHFDCSEGNMNDENEIILTQDSLGLKKRNYKQCEENMKDACNVENALNMTDMEVTPGEDRQDRQDSKIGEKKICSQIGQEMRIMQNVQKKLGENSITFKESKLSRNNSHQVLVASPPAKCKLESITMNPVDLNKKEQQSSEKMRKGSPVSNSNIRRRTDQKPVMMSLLVKEVDSGRFNSMERFIGIPSDKCVHCKKTDGNLWHCSFCVNSFHLECYGKYRNFYPPKKEDGFLCHVCCRKVLHIVRRKKGRQNKRQRLKSNIEKKQKLKRRSLTDWRTVDPLISDSPNGPSNPNGEGQDPSNFSEGESRNADTHQSIIWGKRRVLSREEEESLLSDTVNNHKISYSCPLGGPGGLICCADCASAYSAQLTKVARKIELKSAETAALELKLLNDDLEESRRRLFRVIELHNVNNLRRELT